MIGAPFHLEVTMSLVSGLLGIVKFLDPKYAPLINEVEKIEPQIEANAPLIAKALAEGATAFEAAKAASPDLAATLGEIANHAMSLDTPAVATVKATLGPQAHAAVQERVARAAVVHLAPAATQDDWSAAVHGFPNG
jgi:hypothetical protein